MLEDAHSMLLETRQEQPEAGGLLVAADQEHARQLARLLAEVTHTRPVVVLSDDNEASRKIKRFAANRTEWLVACNMVSEGVDIPRLRVGVYATTITTKMYFRQFLGRIVRITPEPEGVQVAYCYLPADIRLKILAAEVEREQRHHITAKLDKEELPELIEEELPDEGDPKPVWQALHAKNSGVESIIVHGGQMALWSDPALVPPQALMKQAVQKRVSERIVPLTKSERKVELSQTVSTLVGQYHHRSGNPYHHIHAALNRAQRVNSQGECTEEQLEQRIELLRKWLSRL